MTPCLLPSLEQVGEGEVRMSGMPILLIQRNYKLHLKSGGQQLGQKGLKVCCVVCVSVFDVSMQKMFVSNYLNLNLFLFLLR